MKCGFNEVFPWRLRRHGTSQPSLPGSGEKNDGAEVQLGGDQGLYLGTGVEGTDIMDVKGGAAWFGREPDVEKGGHWQIR